MVLYHGSGDRLSTLTLAGDAVGKLDSVLWLAPDVRTAEQYAEDDSEDGDGYVYKVTLTGANLVGEGTHTDDLHQADIDRWRDAGYHGARVVDYDSQEQRHESVVVWDQSVIADVQGMFLVENPALVQGLRF